MSAAPGPAAGVPTEGGRCVLVAHPSPDLYGSDRMLVESVEGMLGAGWSVVVTLPGDGPLVPELRRRGAQVVLCPSPVLRKSALRPRGLAGLVAEVVRAVPPGLRLVRSASVDVVYVSTLTAPLWLLLARLARRPVVCHVHEAEGSAPAAVRTALALPLLLADRVIANSRFSADVLTGALHRLSARTSVVYNGVEGPPGRSPAREVLDGPVRLLYVGRLSPRKGVSVAVEALDALRRRGTPAVLDLVGAVFPGYEWFEEELRATVADRGLTDHVRFRGFQPDVWGFAAQADVLLVPSVADEPFGNTAVEAVLAARPVVVSDTTGLREAASGYDSAWKVPPGDAGAIADAVQAVVRDWPAQRAAAVRDAAEAERRHAPQRYREDVAAAVAAAAPVRQGGVARR